MRQAPGSELADSRQGAPGGVTRQRPSDAQLPADALVSAPDTPPDTPAGADPGPDHAGQGPRSIGTLEEATQLLATPGLVVIAGGPGAGRSSALRHLGDAFRGPVHPGGGLAMLRDTPAFALARAVRVRLPAHDGALLAEAVRSRVRGGLLLLDDLQWADAITLAALPAIAAHCRVAVALRTPHRLSAETIGALRATAAGWLTLTPLSTQAAAALVRRVAPGLDPAGVADVVSRAGGVPLAIEVLARHALAGRGAGPGMPGRETGHTDRIERAGTTPPGTAPALAYAVAQALADLTRPARTAMAALGLLGRPATAAVLGLGVDELAAAGLVTSGPITDRDAGELPEPDQADGGWSAVATAVAPVSPYVAEVAAGLLDAPARQALHRRLAELVPPAEAARHLAAAGDAQAAYERALGAAGSAPTGGERAELLLLACQLPGVDPPAAVRVDAALAALAAGRPRSAAAVLTVPAPLGTAAAVLRGEALLQLGDVPAARQAVAPVPDDAPPAQVAARDRVLLLARLASDPAAAASDVPALLTRHGDPPGHAGLRAAVAAVRAAQRTPGWEYGLASAAAAGGATDPLAARWSAWLLVETLAADGRLAEAATTARSAAQACAADLAYSWQTRFLAAELWCTALRGRVGDPAAELSSPDDVVRRAGDLTDRTLPALARGYAVAAASLVEADGGLLAPARARLAATPAVSGAVAAALDWVTREAAWLDGQPEQAAGTGSPAGARSLVDGLRWITARWAAYDAARIFDTAGDGAGGPPPVRETLAAWAGATADPERFDRAAAAWHDLALREEVRCLLAHGLHETDPARAVPPLLAAERLAEQAGLVVLLGRARRALRRHAVRRDHRGPRAGTELTERERDVLRLVARGEPTRRIAGQLGISAETVETHIRAGMRKLGARTRTEAAALALEVLT